jgi:hypothetical protein
MATDWSPSTLRGGHCVPHGDVSRCLWCCKHCARLPTATLLSAGGVKAEGLKKHCCNRLAKTRCITAVLLPRGVAAEGVGAYSGVVKAPVVFNRSEQAPTAVLFVPVVVQS